MSFYSRKATRIPNYDYSTDNYYFITICTHEKQCIFGRPGQLNQFGMIACTYLEKIEDIFVNVKVDNYIVMPNHVHVILAIENSDADTQSVSTIIGQYKSAVTRKIHEQNCELTVWQRSFHDRIIRNQREYEKIWQYVQFNAQKWKEDCFFTDVSEKI